LSAPCTLTRRRSTGGDDVLAELLGEPGAADAAANERGAAFDLRDDLVLRALGLCRPSRP
jgi:hypothetical protein